MILNPTTVNLETLSTKNYFVPIPSNMTVIIAIGIILVWYILSNLNISLTGNLANILFFSMVIISLIVCFTFFTSSNWSFSNISNNGGFFPMGGKGIFVALAVLSLKFIGFEMTPTLIEETNFPVKGIWKIVLSALFIPAVLYFIVVLALGGMAPWGDLTKMIMPEPELVTKFGLPAIIGIAAIVSGIMHALTTLMGFWTSSARVLYGAAQLNQLPKAFMKLNKNGQPVVSNTVVLLFSIFFCLFTGDNWVQYIYAVSCVAAGFVYLVVCIDAIVLRKKYPKWERPYVAPGGNFLFGLGIVISIWIIIGSSLELPLGGYISLAIYCLIGVVLYAVMESLRKKNPKELALKTLTPSDK